MTTIKAINSRRTATVIEHTMASVTIRYHSKSFPPTDHKPRISYSQMHFLSSLYPLGASGIFPSTTQHHTTCLLSAMVILLTCPISSFAVSKGSKAPHPCFLRINCIHTPYMISAYRPMNSLSQTWTNSSAAVTFQILNQIDSHVRVHSYLLSKCLQSVRT